MKRIGSDGFWKTMGGIAGVAVLLVVLVAANVVISKVRLRLDLTEEKLYTLSKGTRAVLQKLDSDMTLKLFFSSGSAEVPVFVKDYGRQVEDLLHEYAMASGGKIKVEKYDPQPDSDAEEWAQKYGVAGSPFNGVPIYLGLVAVCGGSEATIPVLDPRTEDVLEYNVTRLIYRVTHPEKPVIGVMSSLPVLGGGMTMPGAPRQEPWAAFRDLGQDYTVREVPTSAESIDPTMKGLVVVHPKELSEKTLYALDQFVLGGGKLLVFVDPFCVADMESSGAQSPFGMPKASSDLDRLFSAWGVNYDPERVLGDFGAATSVRGGDGQIEESPLILSLRAANVNGKDVLTAQTEMLLMPFAGALSFAGGKEISFTPLITSGDQSGLVDTMSARFGGQALRNSLKIGGVKNDLAIRLNGKLKTAFPDGKPVDKSITNAVEAAQAPASLKEGESTVIIVADADMIYNRFCVEELPFFFGAKVNRLMNDNVNFLLNAIELIAGSQDMVSIRCRGQFARPFTVVKDLEQQAMKVWREKESELEARLRETEQQIQQIEAGKEKNQKFILTDKQKDAIAKFREDERNIRRDLKEVRKNLKQDIVRLGVKLKLLNIALMPLLVSLTGVGYAIYRRRKG